MRAIYSNDSSHYEPDKEFGLFAKRSIAIYDDEGDAIARVELLLPITPATDEALQQRKDRAIALHQAHDEAEAAKEAAVSAVDRWAIFAMAQFKQTVTNQSSKSPKWGRAIA